MPKTSPRARRARPRSAPRENPAVDDRVSGDAPYPAAVTLLPATALIPALMLGLVAGPVTAAGGVVELDPTEDRGTWQAWGCSLAWWANVFGDREDLADTFFTLDTVPFPGGELPGLGMNFARYNAGACAWREFDGRRMGVSRIIKRYRQMEGFWLDPANRDPESDSWDWSVDARQRAMLRMAHERGATHLELFSNSPMWWMCRNDNPSGAADARDDNLRRDQFDNFAHYLAEVARRARTEWGTPFTTVSPFNEPMSAWWYSDCKQEGCHVSRKAQEEFIPVLRKTLDMRGLRGLTIAASDENTYDEAVDTWLSFRPPVRKLVGRINVHGYQGGNGRRDRLHQLAARDDKALWNSEYGDGDADGLGMARNLLLDFEWLRPTAWAYWQPLDGGGWGLIDADMVEARMKRVNPKYYVLAQFTRHLRPGMRIIGEDSAEIVAAHDRREGRLAVVILNPGRARELTLDLSRFGTRRAAAARWLTEPHGEARYEFHRDLRIEGTELPCPLPARSVVTIEVRQLGH